MKTSFSVLTTMVLLAVAVFSIPGSLADSLNDTHVDNSFQPSYDEKASWAPRRVLKAMGSPQQVPLDANKKKHHHEPNKDIKQAHRALGQAPVVTPASTMTSNSKPTPAPTKTNTPKVTPAKTTTSNSKVTPAPTKPKATPASMTFNSSKKMPAPTTAKPKKTAAPTTTKPKSTPTAGKSKPAPPTATNARQNSDVIQQKHRNLGGNEAKQQQQQQPPNHLKHDGNPSPRKQNR